MIPSLLLAFIVGLSETCATNGFVSVQDAYAEAVRRGGHVPVVICRTATDADLDKVLSKVDLLLLPGGEDVDPALYGAKPSPHLGGVNAARDAFEFRLLRAAVRRELPVVGICRGLQTMNVFFGGTLFQDLPTERSESKVAHRIRGAERHAIEIDGGSRLATATGAVRLEVNSSHHQAVKGLAPGFRIVARAADGTAEAIECDWYPAAAVQFHPERLCVQGDAASIRFFANLPRFAGATRRRAPRRRPIGVFDSGIGGLTVLEKLLTVDVYDNRTGEAKPDGVPDLADEEFVYLGDHANMPYGRYAAEGRSAFLRELAIRDAQFVLGGQGHDPAKVVVIACNTATAYGLEAISAMARPNDARVIGVVNAGVAATLDALKDEKGPCAVAVMATPGTIASGVYERTFRREIAARGMSHVTEIANRGGIGLAEAVENGEAGMEDCARTNLVALVETYRARGGKAPIRAFVLGCTHYPFVLDTFRRTLAELRAKPEYAGLVAEDLTFIDPAVYTAIACVEALREGDLAMPNGARRSDRQVQFFVSVGKDGPLSDAVKYGRDPGLADIGTRIEPLTVDGETKDELERLGKLLPATRCELMK